MITTPHIRIAPKMIRELLKRGKLKHYAVWLYMKYRFRNGCYYGFSWRSLAIKLGISRDMVKRYVVKFVSWGWCRFKTGHKLATHLIFNRQQDITVPGTEIMNVFTYKQRIVKHTIKGILNALYAFTLENAERQRQYMRELKASVGSSINPDRAKAAQIIAENHLVDLTVKRAGRLLHTSSRNANKIILNLERDEKWFSRSKVWLVLEDMVSKAWWRLKRLKKELPAHSFWSPQYEIILPMPSQWTWLLSCNPLSFPFGERKRGTKS
jgi:hypothetical protein